jgi:hypothetical protein
MGSLKGWITTGLRIDKSSTFEAQLTLLVMSATFYPKIVFAVYPEHRCFLFPNRVREEI